LTFSTAILLGLFVGIRPYNWLIISMKKNQSKQKWRDGWSKWFLFTDLNRNRKMSDRASTLRYLITKAVKTISEKAR
jgi:hypothetical protein